MITNDLEPGGGDAGFGQENEGVFTPGLIRADEAGGDQPIVPSGGRSAMKQYVLVGGVVLLGVGVLVFLRQQGVGADLLFADTPKIDYNIDQPIDEQVEARQRQVLTDLSLGEEPVQMPAEAVDTNPFRLAHMTQEDEPELPAMMEPEPEMPTGPSPEELRLAELDRLAAGLALNSVIAGRISLARINSQTYRVGDLIAGEFTVMEITADRTVVLEADGYEYVLEMSNR
ncbi:MAG: hypothetical protein AAGF47_06460 [Planctomycetota bacterium]